MSSDTNLPLYQLYVEVMSEQNYHLPKRMTEREANLVAHQIGIDGFYTPTDDGGNKSFIPPHRIKKVGIVRTVVD